MTNKIEKKSNPLTTQLTDLVDSYHAAVAYTKKHQNQRQDLMIQLEETNIALIENTQRREHPPQKLLIDMSLSEVKDLASTYSQLELEANLLRDKQGAILNQIANTDRAISNFSIGEDYAKRDIWLAVYQDRVDTLKAQHGELLNDLLSLLNRLQKPLSELADDLLPDEPDTSRINRLATELGGLPL